MTTQDLNGAVPSQVGHKVPVIVLNGFLGSGKTTLMRNLLSQAIKKDLSVAVIVNDMSELDVDGEIMTQMWRLTSPTILPPFMPAS